MKPGHILLMLCTVAVWGFNFVAMRVVMEVFSPAQMALARSVLTLVILLPWWQPFKGISWQLTAAALSIGVGSFYLFYMAIGITESLTTVAVGTQLMPPLSAILALLFFHEHISPRKWLGIGIATIGAVSLAGATTSSLSLAALGLTVGAISFFAAGTIVIGKSRAESVWRVLAWIAAVSLPPLALMAGASGAFYPPLQQMQFHHWLALLYVVVFAGLLAQAVLLILYRRYPVSDVAPWILLIPAFAGLSSILVYGESISLSLLLGGGVILFGVWLQQSGQNSSQKNVPSI